MQTANANSNKNQLALFQLTAPELANGLVQNVKKSDDGQTVLAISLAVGRRKDIAKSVNLQGKANSERLNAHLLQLSDRLKEASVGEFVKLASSPDWTGGRFQMRQSKNGVKRATLSIVSVDREQKTISPEQLAAALSKMSEEQQIAIMEQAEALAKQTTAIEVTSETTPATA